MHNGSEAFYWYIFKEQIEEDLQYLPTPSTCQCSLVTQMWLSVVAVRFAEKKMNTQAQIYRYTDILVTNSEYSVIGEHAINTGCGLFPTIMKKRGRM